MASATDGSSRPGQALDVRLVVDSIPALAWSSGPDGSIDFVNQRWLKYTGLSPEASYGWGWQTAIHSEDSPELMAKWEALRNSDNAGECEVRLRRFDGVFRWFLFRRDPLRDESHSVIRWYGTGIDIHDAKQIRTLLAAENRTLEMIANGTKLSDVLNGLCAAIDDHASATSFVCLMDRGGNQLSPIAGPHVPPTFARAITPWPIGPNRGSCGTAAFTKSRVIIPDISNDPLWPDEARSLALSHGFCAAWSEPLTSKDGEVHEGTFTTRDLYPQTLQTLRMAPEEYKLGYDLWKLRAKRLVEKIPHSRRYRLLPHGYQICLVFLKLYETIYAPLTAGILQPFAADQCVPKEKITAIDRRYRAVIQALDDLVDAVGLKAA